MSISSEMFLKDKYVVIKDFIPIEIAQFFTHYCLTQNAINNCSGDEQCPKSITVGNSFVGDTLLEKLWPTMELIVGEELIPTYSYMRIYRNGDELKPHKDREACEVSVTIQLGRSHHYSYPIYMGGKRVDLQEGGAVVYSGCEIEHYRKECDGPEDYYSGQLFLHYVKANGQYKEHAGDQKFEQLPFVRNRTWLMENK